MQSLINYKLGTVIDSQLISWPRLAAFLEHERGRNAGDVDDVLWVREDVVRNDHLYALQINGEMVGFACVTWASEYLSFLYAKPEFRGRGISTAFLCQHRIKCLLVRPDNLGAISTYERNGFRKTVELKFHNRIRMERE